MLRALFVNQFVIVDRLELEFDSGFTVLTGETGAGKSILIDALDLLLGGKADANVVRQGAAVNDRLDDVIPRVRARATLPPRPGECVCIGVAA